MRFGRLRGLDLFRRLFSTDRSSWENCALLFCIVILYKVVNWLMIFLQHFSECISYHLSFPFFLFLLLQLLIQSQMPSTWSWYVCKLFSLASSSLQIEPKDNEYLIVQIQDPNRLLTKADFGCISSITSNFIMRIGSTTTQDDKSVHSIKNAMLAGEWRSL